MEDFIFNGQAHGQVADKLLACNFDTSVLRPWIGADGKSYITQNVGGKPKVVRTNAEATLRKDAWIAMDEAILKAAQPRLRFVADLRAAGLTYTIPNGMGKMTLQYERMSDINDADISMDPIRFGADDRPHFDLQNLPLPVIHKDFQFSARQIQASRDSGTPLDTTMAEMCGRKVAEGVEKFALGLFSPASYTYGRGTNQGTVYGATNFPYRITKTLTAPTSSGWTGSTLRTEVSNMKQLSQNKYHYGPWVLYFSTAWDEYLDDDFKTNSDKTVRQRILELDGISDIRTLDYLTGYDCLLVEMTSEVIRLVIGLEIQTLQWDTIGGMLKNFKVLTIMVPQLRADINDNTGIVHGTT
jgi:Family of unknown function (DUF6260)